jgi:capsid protein
MDWMNEANGSIDFGGSKENTNFGYDGAGSSSKNRKPKKQKLTTEDKQLRATDRKVLQSTTRDLRRNEVAARWILSKHIDFVVKHQFQPNTGDEATDNLLREFYNYAAKKEQFDISGRYDLNTFMRMVESSAVVDGDIYCVRQRGGYLQAIESDRVRQPNFLAERDGVSPSNGSQESPLIDWVQGIKIDVTGRPKQYAIWKRAENNYQFERNVSAKKIIPMGFWDRFDQTRGISPLAAVVDTIMDLNESYDYALAKAKVAQLFALSITREAQFGIGDDDQDGDSNPDRTVSFDKGPQILDLDPGEEAKFLNSTTPETATQDFWKDMIGMTLKSLNIPYSFWDESYTNFNGSRTALILYLRSCEADRERQVAFRNDWFAWRLKVGILKGEIQLPATFEIDPKNWLWVPDGLQYWDTMKEASADVLLIENGLRSRTEIRRERFGDEWADVARKLSEEKKLLETLDILPPDLRPLPEPQQPQGTPDGK